ncbi:acyl-CoA dehydrogenase family protein [Parasphingopyxis marina]|uniref:Acyl-CoA/acyl-ACP dehydrogenase n=1 Tax=Parasphingopyxis marina TaxID=2761622 RepID=A0A842HWZ0_9SPHN|nr:acyl-CoA dehydrogenase family protein [Parasphingopyxis marina]MBC2776799.1 acyl-CoA/acyl-ACP dehydrogenase [Parasphingopyxis marina]
MAGLTEEQAMLRDMAREWSNNENPVSAFRTMRDAGHSEGYDPAVYAEMAQMGWTGILVPEEHGGSGFGFVGLGLVLEELGRNVAAAPLAASSAAAMAIMLGGSDEQKAKYLRKIASGELVATLAIDEGAHHDPEKIETAVEGGKLNGRKAFVPEGDSAGLFVVAARDGLYLVDGDAEGVSREARNVVDSRSHAEIALKDVAIGNDSRLAEGGDDLLDKVLDCARAIACAEMLGLAVQAFETTNEYLKTRVQFGQALSSFQALQHRMAELFADIALMRSSVEGALQMLDSNITGAAATVAVAKATANDVVHRATHEMIQLHGGIGMTDEHDAGFYFKRARVLEQQWGSAGFHRNRFATLNGY